MVNQLRSTGCSCGNEQMPPVGSLRWNAKMAAAATQHSKDMANNAHFSHTGTDGSSAGDRLKQQGYNWQPTERILPTATLLYRRYLRVGRTVQAIAAI